MTCNTEFVAQDDAISSQVIIENFLSDSFRVADRANKNEKWDEIGITEPLVMDWFIKDEQI